MNTYQTCEMNFTLPKGYRQTFMLRDGEARLMTIEADATRDRKRLFITFHGGPNNMSAELDWIQETMERIRWESKKLSRWTRS